MKFQANFDKIILMMILIFSFMSKSYSLDNEYNKFQERSLDLVKELNKSYNSIGDGSKNSECCGILARRIPGGFVDYKNGFAKLAKEELEANAVRLVYLRRDSLTTRLESNIGFFIQNQNTAPDFGPYCIYPFSNQLNMEGRADNGCGLKQSQSRAGDREDKSTCSFKKLEPDNPNYVIDAAIKWHDDFNHRSNIDQCSLPTATTLDYDIAVRAHNISALDEIMMTSPNAVLAKPWNEEDLSSLPITAFYVDVTQYDTDNNTLQLVQKFQYDYYQETHKLIPVLRIDLSNKDEVISFPQSYQNFTLAINFLGEFAESSFNEKYNNTSDRCSNDMPAYTCSGVIILATKASLVKSFWTSRKHKLSFSYFRTDLSNDTLAFDRKLGYVIDASESGIFGGEKADIYCTYPFDGDTDNREDHGCGINRLFPSEPGECYRRGIKPEEDNEALDKWWGDFNSQKPNVKDQSRYAHQCSFSGKPYDFQLSLRARRMANPVKENVKWRQNEVVLKMKGDDTLVGLPIQAIFYLDGADNLTNAKIMQRSLYENILDRYPDEIPYIPILKLNLNAASGKIFSYNYEDQNK